MDTSDSPRSSVPARMPAQRSVAPLTARFGVAQAEAAPSPISIRVALRGARRYWWLILALWAVGSAGVGAAIYLKVKPLYRASSMLRVDPSGTDLYHTRNQESLDPFLQTQVQLIVSPNVLTAAGTNPKAAVMERIQTAGDVVLELRKAIQVSILPGTYLIEVSMTSPLPQEASILVNAVVDAFMDANLEWSDGMTRNQIDNLTRYYADLKNQSDELERRLKDLVAKGDNGGVIIRGIAKAAKPGEAPNPADQAALNLTIDNYRRYQNELFDVGIELANATAVLESTRRAAENAARDPRPVLEMTRVEEGVRRRIESDPELLQVDREIRGFENRVEKISGQVRSGSDPALKAAQDKLREAQKHKAILTRNKSIQYRDAIEAPIAQASDPQKDVRDAEVRVQSLTVRQTSLKAELDKLKVETKKLATDDVESMLINEKRSALLVMQDAVNRRLEQLKFESKGEARIRSINVAFPPGRPITDKRMQYLAMTPVGILGAVLGLIVLLEIRSGRVADPDLLSSRVRHEVFSIAPLPNLRPGEDAASDKAEQRLARFVQSLDHLRVALCEGGVPGEGRCVMITSATGGEGKTTLSAHLAARCANAGTSTLLVDADMRRASLGRLLDVPNGPGLGDVLAGEAIVDDALITVQAGGFHFLSAGMPGRDPSRVLKSSRLAELIGRLRQDYDLVIIDTPPILPVADALILGRWCDGAVMAARFDASRLPLVERANRQLAVAGIPVLGVVVNGVKGRDANYGNYAYSYNYPGRVERVDDAPVA